jgi:hypothetical protein
MTALAIDINDAGLVVANDSGVLAVEPGFASVERGKIVTGDAARARARRHPRQSSNRFWSALGGDVTAFGADLGVSATELAYAQLEALWAKVGGGVTDVLLVVPGAYRSDQLGVLLGLAQECSIPVRTFVDAAVAASVRPYPDRQLVYVDAGLYRTSVTLIEQNGEAQVRAEHSLGQGLSALADTVARRIADLFVRANRFDPFAHADAEQMLYDRLPGWLAVLQREERLELKLKHAGEESSVVAEREAVLAVAEGFYRAVRQLIAQHREPGHALVVQLSDRLAALPGLTGELARLDHTTCESLEAGHAARGALLAASAGTAAPGPVKLLKRLRWRAEPKAAAAAADRPAAVSAFGKTRPPTHIVYGGLAYRVGAEGLVIGREADPQRRTVLLAQSSNGVSRQHCEVVLRDGELKLRDLSTFGTFVNESKAAGETTLQRADVIRIGSPGAELHVVGLEGEE